MVAKTEDVLDRLRSLDPDKKLKAVKDVRNKIIGNPRQKTEYITNGAVRDILDLLESSEDSQMLVQCAACAGSFARCEEGMEALLVGDGAVLLGRSLANTDSEVVKAAVRSLHAVYQSEEARDLDGFSAAPLETLAQLLKAQDLTIAEMAARVLSLLCESCDEREHALHLGCHRSLLRLLQSNLGSAKHAALAGLAVLTACQSSVVDPAFGSDLVKEALNFITNAQCPVAAVQLDACANIVHVCIRQRQELCILVLQHRVLPVLLRLLAIPNLRQFVPRVLSHLLLMDSSLAIAAVDANAMPLLCSMLVFFEQWRDHCLLGVLRSLETVFEHHREAQAQYMDHHEWPLVSQLLMQGAPEVRLAACHCLRQMFGRAQAVHLNQLDHEFAEIVCDFARSDDPVSSLAGVRLASTLLVHGSAIKDQLMEQKVLGMLARLCGGPSEIRLASAKAILNAAADIEDEEIGPNLFLANEVPVELVAELCLDAVPEIRAAAYGILQNVLNRLPMGSETMKHWCRTSPVNLLDLLVQQLLAELSAQGGQAAVVPLLHGLANAAALGDDALKFKLMSSKLPECLPALLTDTDASVVTAALWLLIGLLERSPNLPFVSQLALRSRRDTFIQMGISVSLSACMESSAADVRNRALTVICSLDVPEAD